MEKLKIIKQVLTSKEKKTLLIVFFFMIINGFLEAFSIGALIPLLSIVFGIENNDLFPNEKGNILKNFDIDIGLDFLILLIVVVYIFKYLFFVFFTRFQTSFILNLKISLQKRLYEDYLKKPIKFHNKMLSAEIVRNINNEVSIFINNFLSSILTFLLSLFTIIMIVILLLMINLKTTILVVLLFGSIYLIIGQIFTKYLLKIGKIRQHHDKYSIKYIYRSLRSIIEIKLLELEKFYVENYYYHIHKIAKQSVNRNVIGILPRVIFEASLIMFILFLIYHYKSNDLSVESLFAQLLLFATAAFRVLPALNNILKNRQNIEFGLPAAQLLRDITVNFEKQIIRKNKKILNSISFKNKISFQKVSFVYDDSSKNIMNNFDLDISKGSSIGIVGSNGSGKSTLVKLFCGLLEPTKGTIEVDGVDIYNDITKWRKLIGFVPQEINLIDGTIRENICLGLNEKEINNNRIMKIIEQTQLKDFIERLPNGIHSYIGEEGVNISGGEKQKLGITRTLYRNHEILILDEATSNLDNKSEIELVKMLDNEYKNITKIIVSHRTEALKFCDEIYNLDEIKKN
tara:strand:- start:5593 stop:7308 length:1716 start_codon:yes stop_codon:yes gene_type:complete